MTITVTQAGQPIRCTIGAWAQAGPHAGYAVQQDGREIGVIWQGQPGADGQPWWGAWGIGSTHAAGSTTLEGAVAGLVDRAARYAPVPA